MSGISFAIITSGNDEQAVNLVIDSIEREQIPDYDIMVIGGMFCNINRNNVRHIPIIDSIYNGIPLNVKKNAGARNAKCPNLVIMHDYYNLTPGWYQNVVEFGFDWDICVHKAFHNKSQGSMLGNGWRTEKIATYPEIPFAMPIPMDIECFIPYMAIQGAYWMCKTEVMLKYPMDETLLKGQLEDIEWSSKVVPGWRAEKLDQNEFKIKANPNACVVMAKDKPFYPGNPNWFELQESFNWLWEELRAGYIRPGTWYYDSHDSQIKLSR